MRRRIGFSTAQVFSALDRGRRYGLDIMRETGLPSGTVYPTLTRAETGGLVRGRWEVRAAALADGRPRRRYYELTVAGKAALADALERFGRFAETSARTRGLT